MEISVTIDERGDLHVDLSGYIGGSCQFEEEELRRMLAELGLKAEVKGKRSKIQGTPRYTTTHKKPSQRIRTRT